MASPTRLFRFKASNSAGKQRTSDQQENDKVDESSFETLSFSTLF